MSLQECMRNNGMRFAARWIRRLSLSARMALFGYLVVTSAIARASEKGAPIVRKSAKGEDALGEKRQDCGIECLYVLMRMNGRNPDLEKIRGLVPLTKEGASAREMQRVASEMGLDLECVRCGPDGIESLALPAIAHIQRLGSPESSHYVVMTDVTSDTVSFVDPTINRIYEIQRSEWARASSGFYLTPPAPAFDMVSTVLWLGVGCSFFFLWLWVRRPKTIQGIQERFSLEQGARSCCSPMILVFILAVAAGAGCSKSGTAGKTQATRMIESSLEIRPAKLDLGRFQWGADAEGTFTIRNLTSSPLSFRLGAPSCECLNVVVEPLSKKLVPKAEGRIIVKLASKTRKSAGRIEAHVPLFVGKSDEHHLLQVTGYLEGLDVPGSYTVRPADFRSGDIPRLQMNLITREPDTPFAIVSIQVYRKSPKKSPIYGFQFQPEKMTITKARRRWDEDCFPREIAVPARVTEEINSPIGGEILITYKVREEEHTCSVSLYLLPK